MLDAKCIAIESEKTVASFEHYGRLFRMLMPSLKGTVLHDGFGEVLWSSDEGDLEDSPDLVKETIANAITDPAEFPGVVRVDADRALYSFAVRSEQVELLGAVTLLAIVFAWLAAKLLRVRSSVGYDMLEQSHGGRDRDFLLQGVRRVCGGTILRADAQQQLPESHDTQKTPADLGSSPHDATPAPRGPGSSDTDRSPREPSDR